MKCERCDRSFRDGDVVHAVPTRVVMIRNGREQWTVVEKMLCAYDYAGLTWTSAASGEKVRPSSS